MFWINLENLFFLYPDEFIVLDKKKKIFMLSINLHFLIKLWGQLFHVFLCAFCDFMRLLQTPFHRPFLHLICFLCKSQSSWGRNMQRSHRSYETHLCTGTNYNQACHRHIKSSLIAKESMIGVYDQAKQRAIVTLQI